jgi:hypothetical protein
MPCFKFVAVRHLWSFKDRPSTTVVEHVSAACSFLLRKHYSSKTKTLWIYAGFIVFNASFYKRNSDTSVVCHSIFCFAEIKDSLVFVDSSSLLIASEHSVLSQQTPPPCQSRWFGSVLLAGLIFIGWERTLNLGFFFFSLLWMLLEYLEYFQVL